MKNKPETAWHCIQPWINYERTLAYDLYLVVCLKLPCSFYYNNMDHRRPKCRIIWPRSSAHILCQLLVLCRKGRRNNLLFHFFVTISMAVKIPKTSVETVKITKDPIVMFKGGISNRACVTSNAMPISQQFSEICLSHLYYSPQKC